MSASPPRSPDPGSGRSSALQLCAPASYLLLTLIIANQAAARTDTSLPYLVQVSPEALRFARVPPVLPRPAYPAIAEKNPLTPEELISGGQPAPSDLPHASGPPENTPATLPGQPSSHPAPGSQVAPPLGRIEIIPDAYAPNHVRIEDLLPFFIAPPPRPVPPSRATYDVK
jgi:hypothetical protein